MRPRVFDRSVGRLRDSFRHVERIDREGEGGGGGEGSKREERSVPGITSRDLLIIYRRPYRRKRRFRTRDSRLEINRVGRTD